MIGYIPPILHAFPLVRCVCVCVYFKLRDWWPKPIIGENPQLVIDEPVEFEK